MAESTERPLIRRNFSLGVINGSFWLLARALTDQDIILPAFAVALMGDNPIYVGLLVSMVSAGWFWPPLVMTPIMAVRRRRHVYYQASTVIRMVAIIGAGLAVWLLAEQSPTLAFITVALCYLVFTSGGGIGLIPFMSVITDSVPPERRGRFFAMRRFFGGLMAFGAGFWIEWLLSDRSGLSFPDNYAYMFGVAALVSAIALGSFWFAREPEHKVEKRRLPMRLQFARGLRRTAREPDFLRLLGARVTMRVSYGLLVPFLVPFAYRHLGMTEAMVGIALAVRVLFYSVFNVLWSRISAVRGNRLLLTITAGLHAVALTLAMVTPMLPPVTVGSAPGLHFDLRLALLMVVFAVFGASRSGWLTGQNAYLLDYTPERTRPVYFAMYYLAGLPTAFVPLLAALIIGSGGRYMLAFALAGVAIAVDLLLCLHLRKLRDGGDGLQSPDA